MRTQVNTMKDGLQLSQFEAYCQEEFGKLVSDLKEPRRLCYPEYLLNFIIRTLNPCLQSKNVILTKADAFNKELTSSGSFIFVTPACIENIREIIPKFKFIPKFTKTIFIIPRSNAFVEQILRENDYEPVYDLPKNTTKEILIRELHNDFCAIDNLYFLLPNRFSFYHIFVQNEMADLFAISRAISKIEMIFGKIPQVATVGAKAEIVSSLISGIENQCSVSTATIPQIDTLLLFDRTMDMITPFLSQTTFEAMIDSTLGINYGIIDCKSIEGAEHQTFEFTNKNSVVRNLRATNVPDVAQKFMDFAKLYKETSENIKDVKKDEYERGKLFKDKEKISSIKQIIDDTPIWNELLKIFNYVLAKSTENPACKSIFAAEGNIFSESKTYALLEEHLISIFNDWPSALKLMAIESAAGCQHAENFVHVVQREAVAEFGISAMESMLNLQKLNLLSPDKYLYEWKKFSSEFFSSDKKDEKENKRKEEISQCCSGFIPVAIQIADRCSADNIQLFKHLNSPGAKLTVTGEKPTRAEGEKRRVLVFFIGGVTPAEVGIFAHLTDMSQGKVEYIVGSTDQINGNQLIRQICPCLQNC